MPTSLIKLPQEQYPLVNRFYKNNGHKGKVRGNETVYVMRDESGIIASLRLCPKRDGWLLRSLWVAKNRRNEGIGSALVQSVMGLQENHPCWCYPYDHLGTFYETSGFVELPAADAPEDIREPFEAYQNKGSRILLMVCKNHRDSEESR